MPNVSFFPSRDADLLQWAQGFSTKIAIAPTSLGLTAALCTAFAGYVSTFSATMTACAPDVRNKSAVTAKNQARDAVKYHAKLLANIINGQANVTDAQKQELGLNVRKPPEPVPVPTVSPTIEIVSSSAWIVKIRLRPPSGGRRGLIPGAQGIMIFSHIGTTPPDDIGQWKYEGITSRDVADIQYATTIPVGTRVWITSFYYNNRKQSGPATPPLAATIQGGTVSLAA